MCRSVRCCFYSGQYRIILSADTASEVRQLLAAKYAKIKEVLVPEKNRPDIEEMDKEIIQGLNIQFVDNMKEVLGEALA